MLDIVIPAFNAHDMTWRCVAALCMHPPAVPHQITLVDDGSADPTPFHNLPGRLVRHPTNLGPHAAWNSGWRDGDGKYAAFINNDVVVAPHTLERMLAYLSDSGAPYIGARDVGRGRAFDPALLFAEEADSPASVVAGYYNSCFMVPRFVLEELDGFDDRMRNTFADADFCARVEAAYGQPCRVLSSAVCFHGRSVSRKRVGVVKDVEQMMKDQAVFRKKWAGRPDVLAKHPPYTRDSALASTQRVWLTEGEK